jgi:hypothetical protein
LQDLSENAVNTKQTGHSYEVFGVFNPLPGEDSKAGIKKTEKSVLNRLIYNYSPFIGSKPGASAFFLMMDADDTFGLPNAAPDNYFNNWPDPGNNHGKTGAAANFCDGHAEFISLKRFLNVWNLSQDSNGAGH